MSNRTDKAILLFFFFFLKLIKRRRMYYVQYGCYNKSKTVRFMLGFHILRVYKFIFVSKYLLTLSLALNLESRLTQNDGKLLQVFSFVCLPVLLFFPFHLFGKAESMNKYF